MQKQKRKSGFLLLAVFTAILLAPVFQSPLPHSGVGNEITVIHAQDYSGEATENISRAFTDCATFANRVTHDFTCLSLQAVHSTLSHTGYIQINSCLLQSAPPVKVYKRIQQFLI